MTPKSHPGLTLQDMLDERQVPVPLLYTEGEERNELYAFTEQRGLISRKVAERLELLGFGTADFWMERQRQYEEKR